MSRPVKIRAWMVVLGCFAVYSLTFTFRPSTDAHLNVVQTRALVLHGDIDLGRYGETGGFTVDRNGSVYSVYGIGISLLIAPFYFVLSHSSASVIAHHAVPAIVLASLAAGAMFALLRRLFDPWMAACGTVLFAFGTTMWPLATTALWSHGPVAFLVAVGLLAFFSESRWSPAVCGLALGAAVFVRLPLLFTALFAGIYYLSRGRSHTSRFIAGLSIPIAALLVTNTILWGAPFNTGYTYVDEGFGTDVVSGVVGILASWRRGLLVYSPAFALSALGAVHAVTRLRNVHDRRVAAVAGGALSTILLYAAYRDWHAGDDQFGYRYLIDVTPALVLLTGYALSRFGALRWPAAALTAASVVSMALGTQTSRRGWDFDPAPSGPGDSALGNAFDAFLRAPGHVLIGLAGIAVVAVLAFHAAKTSEG